MEKGSIEQLDLKSCTTPIFHSIQIFWAIFCESSIAFCLECTSQVVVVLTLGTNSAVGICTEVRRNFASGQWLATAQQFLLYFCNITHIPKINEKRKDRNNKYNM